MIVNKINETVFGCCGVDRRYWDLVVDKSHLGANLSAMIIDFCFLAIMFLKLSKSDKLTKECQEQKRSRLENQPESEIGIGTTADTLLLLFNLQRHRMLSNVKQGGKVPMAIAASNNREYSNSWSQLIAKALAEESGEGKTPNEMTNK
jgi:hypothetical protein